MFDDFIGVDTAPLYAAERGNKIQLHLLWGDGVHILQRGAQRTQVRARGRSRVGYVDNRDLGGKSLLELYFIDVGQGDGVLIKTPNFRHVLIDGGYARAKQDTGKNAADFVDWKFYQDYGLDQIHLDAMLASHCDADHYGGLWDLLDVAQNAELNCTAVQVENFYHAGVGWWCKAPKGRYLGPAVRKGGERFLTRLLGDRAAVEADLPELQGEWGDFMRCVLAARRADGLPTTLRRLSSASAFLPGFESDAGGEPVLHVLAPVERSLDGKPALRALSGGDDQNTNGNSLLLRLDFGHVRILLTGDLNRRSQQALLRDYAASLDKFRCDVAKGCHHGSDDVSYAFLQAMQPAVTVISSGDNEGHDHPRPAVVSASALTGFVQVEGDELCSPLIYATELSRSISLGRPARLLAGGVEQELARASLTFLETKAGDLRPRKKERTLDRLLVVAGLIYGLVNVRSDGQKILCATLNEKDHSWNVRSLQGRF